MKRLTIRVASFVLCVVALCFLDAGPVLVASAQEPFVKLYVVNFGADTAILANFDGSGAPLDRLGASLAQPRDIALDAAGGKMYVVNTNENGAPPAPRSTW